MSKPDALTEPARQKILQHLLPRMSKLKEGSLISIVDELDSHPDQGVAGDGPRLGAHDVTKKRLEAFPGLITF